MLTLKTQQVADANCSAMETETIQKNGVMPKDPSIIRSRHHRISKIILLFIGIYFAGSLWGQNLKSTFSKNMEYVNKTYENNEKYKGQLVNGSREGLGIYYWNVESFYFGNWHDGEMHGYSINLVPAGRIITNCNDCKVYVGNWISGYKSGKGTCYDKDGNLIYYGNFSNSKPTETYPTTGNYSSYKFKTIEYTSGNKYIGETKDGKRDGYGIFVWKDGNLWFGYWEDGKRKGTGLYLSYNASWEKQTCQDDNCNVLASSSSSNSNQSNGNNNYAQNSNNNNYNSNNNWETNGPVSTRKNKDGSIDTRMECMNCHGAGNKICFFCGGTGQRLQPGSFFPVVTPDTYVTCGGCSGAGKTTCSVCYGAGYTYFHVDAAPVVPINPPVGGGYNNGGSAGGSSSGSNSGYTTCSSCGGGGKCKHCYGTGYVGNMNSNSSTYTYDSRKICSICQGSGNCKVCYGSGKIRH